MISAGRYNEKREVYWRQFSWRNPLQKILKQWIASKARSDWPFNSEYPLLINVRATRTGFAPENIVIVAEINKWK